jgi:hypothetical protein
MAKAVQSTIQIITSDETEPSAKARPPFTRGKNVCRAD